MMAKTVEGCKGCPLFRGDIDRHGPYALCKHPRNEDGQRFLDFEVVADGGAPDWCPLLDGPLLVQRK